MSFELLLTDLHTLRPALDLSLDAASLHHAPRPAQRAPSVLSMTARSNNLVRALWGVVVPEGPAGEERLAWIRPLAELRRRQCGLDEVPILRVRAGLGTRDARQWRTEYEAMHPQRRPGYLLLLGDLHEISLELQQELMAGEALFQRYYDSIYVFLLPIRGGLALPRAGHELPARLAHRPAERATERIRFLHHGHLMLLLAARGQRGLLESSCRTVRGGVPSGQGPSEFRFHTGKVSTSLRAS